MIKSKFKDPIVVKKKIDQMISLRSKLNSMFFDLNKYLRLYVNHDKGSVIEDSSASIFFEKLVRKIIYTLINKNERWFKLTGEIITLKKNNFGTSFLSVNSHHGIFEFKDYNQKLWFNELEKNIYTILSNPSSCFYDTVFNSGKLFYGFGTNVCKISTYPYIEFRCENINNIYFEFLSSQDMFFFKFEKVNLDYCLNKFKGRSNFISSGLKINIFDTETLSSEVDLYYFVYREDGKFKYNYLISFNGSNVIIEDKEKLYFDYIVDIYDNSFDGSAYGVPLCYDLLPSLIKHDLINKDIFLALQGLVSPPVAISKKLIEVDGNIFKEDVISLLPGSVNILDDINLDFKVLTDTNKVGLQPFLTYKELHLSIIKERLEFDTFITHTFRKTDGEHQQIMRDKETQLSFYILKFENLISNLLSKLVFVLLQEGFVKKPKNFDIKNDCIINIFFDFGLSAKMSKLNNIRSFIQSLTGLGLFQLKPDILKKINFDMILNEFAETFDVERFILKEQVDDEITDNINANYNFLLNKKIKERNFKEE